MLELKCDKYRELFGFSFPVMMLLDPEERNICKYLPFWLLQGEEVNLNAYPGNLAVKEYSFPERKKR